MNKMKELDLKVTGMVCGGCENRVKNSLNEMEGIKEVSANHETNQVVVKYEGDINIEDVKERIDDLGFKVEE